MSIMYEVSSVAGNRLDAAAAIRNAARVRPQDTVKSHMLRFLRRSKSMAHRSTTNTNTNASQQPNSPANNTAIANTNANTNNIKASGNNIIKASGNNMNRNTEVKKRENTDRQTVQVARNGVVVAIVDGLPFVVGAKNKNKVCVIYIIFCLFDLPFFYFTYYFI